MIALFVHHIYYLKKLFIQKKLFELLINSPIFSTITIIELSKHIFRQSSLLKQQLIQDILSCNISSLLKHLKDKSLKNQLRIITSGEPIKIMRDKSPLSQILNSQAYINSFEYDKAIHILNNLNDKSKSPYLAALKLLSDAQISAYNGDLLNASVWSIQAIHLFHQKHALFEEGLAYFTLGKIYHAGDFNDSAYFILQHAHHIFRHLSSHHKNAEVLGSLGLMTAEECRFDEAEKFFSQALSETSFTENKTLFNLIICQQALLDITQNSPSQALSRISNINHSTTKDSTQALIFDIKAQAHLALNNWQQAKTFAMKSHNLYKKLNNQTAAAEIKSIADFAHKKLAQEL